MQYLIINKKTVLEDVDSKINFVIPAGVYEAQRSYSGNDFVVGITVNNTRHWVDVSFVKREIVPNNKWFRKARKN